MKIIDALCNIIVGLAIMTLVMVGFSALWAYGLFDVVFIGIFALIASYVSGFLFFEIIGVRPLHKKDSEDQ